MLLPPKPFATKAFMNRFLAAQQAVCWTPPGQKPTVHNRCSIRREALNSYIGLRRAADRGNVPEARRLRNQIKQDPQFSGAAEATLQKAYLKHVLSEARRLRGVVRMCLSCKTPMAIGKRVGGTCMSCGSKVLIRQPMKTE